MAMYNEILSGRYNRLLQKMLSMKGAAPAPQLGGDISAGIELESDRPEWGFLSGDIRFSSVGAIAAAATFNSRLRFRVTAPNMLYVLEGLLVSAGGVTTVEVYTGGVSYNINLTGGILTSKSRDLRFAEKPSGSQTGSSLVGSFTNGDTATAGQLVQEMQVLANSPVWLPMPYMLCSPAGQGGVVAIPQGFDVRAGTVNIALIVTAYWRERQIEEGELLGG